MEFSRQEYCSGLPFLSPGDLPDPGIEPTLLRCRQIIYADPPEKPIHIEYIHVYVHSACGKQCNRGGKQTDLVRKLSAYMPTSQFYPQKLSSMVILAVRYYLFLKVFFIQVT